MGCPVCRKLHSMLVLKCILNHWQCPYCFDEDKLIIYHSVLRVYEGHNMLFVYH